MKFQGKDLVVLATGEVKLPRPDGGMLVFKVRATSLGDEAKGERLFPNPRPPVDFMYDRKGTIVRDQRSDTPLREPNVFDEQYLKRLEEAALMQMVVSTVDALSLDENIEWGTDAPRDSKAFYEAALAEMKASGLTFGDMKLVMQRARELGNLDSKTLEKAAEGFSEKGAA